MQSEEELRSGRTADSGRGRPALLCIGNDETLLSYRCKVLKLAGFEVFSARPRPDETNQFSSLCRLHGPVMAIACHTLTSRQRRDLARELREACPDLPLLALTNGALNAEEAEMYDVLLDSLDGPAELIRQVRSHI
jgi:hypothetical protein